MSLAARSILWPQYAECPPTKRTAGRPPRAREAASEILKIRVTPGEKRLAEQLATERATNVSTLVRAGRARKRAGSSIQMLGYARTLAVMPTADEAWGAPSVMLTELRVHLPRRGRSVLGSRRRADVVPFGKSAKSPVD